MELVTLKFNNLWDLWSFKLQVDARVFEINTDKRTITCMCHDYSIMLALDQYDAKLTETAINSFFEDNYNMAST